MRSGTSGGGRGRRRSVFLMAGVALLGLVLSACASNTPQDALKPASPDSRVTNHLFVPVFWIAAGVFVLVEGLVVYAVVRFRRRSDDDSPVQVHGNSKLELTWTIMPALLLLGIGVFTIKTVFSINRYPKGPNVVNATVIGHRWWWEFRYPDSGVVTANQLYIPTGKEVVLTLESDDVIHSFWPPKLAGKVDVVPGQKNRMKISADNPGTYDGQCAEYCGTSHANMRLEVIAVTPADFDKWISQQKAGPAALPAAATTSTTAAGGTATATTTSAAAGGQALFLSKGCAGCHTISGISAGAVGPNLTHLQSRTVFAGAIFDLNDQNLRRWLRDPPGEKPGSVMPNLNLSEDEITQLIAYLDTLK